jgi:hypothetical protein
MDAETNEWQESPIPEKIKVEDVAPQMTETATLGNIFFDPGRTFEDLRRKPRFLLALLITAILFTSYIIAFQQKMGDERYRQFITEQIEKSPQAGSLSAEQKKQQIDISVTITKYIGFAFPVFFVIFTFLGALFYWLGVKAMGGIATYMQSLSVYVYSSFVPTVLWAICNLIVLFLKSADDIDLATSSRGVLQTNLSMFMNGKEMPVLATLIGTFDLFAIWGIILATIGLHKVGKISKAAALAIVIFVTLIGVAWRVFNAFTSGNPQ